MPWIPLSQVSKEAVAEFARSFRKRAKFLVDESAGEWAARFLHDNGWNACYVGDIGLTGRSDLEVFAYGWKHKRVILTHDTDFLDDRRFPFNRNPGVIVLPGASGGGDEFVIALSDITSMVGRFAGAYQGDKIEITAEQIWTVRVGIKAKVVIRSRGTSWNPMRFLNG